MWMYWAMYNNYYVNNGTRNLQNCSYRYRQDWACFFRPDVIVYTGLHPLTLWVNKPGHAVIPWITTGNSKNTHTHTHTHIHTQTRTHNTWHTQLSQYRFCCDWLCAIHSAWQGTVNVQPSMCGMSPLYMTATLCMVGLPTHSHNLDVCT